MATTTRFAYPEPPTSSQVDDYHGMTIADPYRPLEDSDAPATRAWIEAENSLTDSVIGRSTARDAIRRRLTELWDHPRSGAPWRRGERWFQLRNTGLQDQDVLWTASTPDGEGRVVFDPNALNREGTTSLGAINVADSGELVALALSFAGSDWHRWRVHDVEVGEDLEDRIEWSKFSSAAWTIDGAGFFYGRYPEPPPDAAYDAPNHDMQLRYHRLGTASESDPIVFATPDHPDWGFEPEVSEDGRLLIVSVWRGTDPESRVFAADLTGAPDAAAVRPVLDKADAAYQVVGSIGTTLYLLTDLEAPRGRLIAVDVRDPGQIREVVAEADDTLERVQLVGNRFALAYLHHAHARLVVAELDGRVVGEVGLPTIGSMIELSGRREDLDLYLTLASFVAPPQPFAVRMADLSIRAQRPAELAWNPDDFVSEQVFVTSEDGTRVPMFLTRRRDIEPNGDVRTLLHAYGGFNIATSPGFKAEWLAWMERGGLLAVACLRGGGEYGKAWHDDGRLGNKQHVFDDYAACLRWLAASGWTRAERIAISGRSNGGLLVGATITQHPELYGVALAEVGVMDMLRFERFTIGWGWTSDYGSVDDPVAFRTMLAYSPLHNLRAGTAYPPTLVTTGDHDDRVVPGHSFKFAAAMQAAQGGAAPVLIRIDTDAGHGVGKPVHKLIDERADVLAFLELMLG